MDRSILQPILATAQTRLLAGRERALADSSLPSGLAYLTLPLLQRLAAEDDLDDVVVQLNAWVGTQHRKELRRALNDNVVETLRTLDGESPLGAACRALIEALASPEERDSLGIQMQITASDGGNIRDVRQVVVQGDYYESPRNLEEERQERALLDYLRSLQGECSPLQLNSIDTSESRYQQPMRLEQVYVGLHTETQVELTEEEHAEAERRGDRLRAEGRDSRPLTALEAFSQQHPARLMLLGAPGSGKSTFINHLTLCLTGATLHEHLPDEPQPEDGWLNRLPRWTLGPLLPVRVILRDFAAFPPLARAKRGSVKLLRDFLKATPGMHADALQPITAALTEGRAILLCDGLDEVVGDVVLDRVVESITAAAHTYRRSLVLVTCRVLDYQDNPRRHLRGFRIETLAPLTNEQIDQFVDAWYTELAATGRQMLGNAAVLRQAIATRPELRELARMPLLLTMMAVVHAGKGTLPDARALLYYECVELLLLRWRQEPGQPDVLAQLQLPQFRASDLLRLMARIGFTAHEQAARDPEAANRPADLSRSQVQRLIERAFTPYTANDPIRRDGLVSIMLHAIATRNGLLLKRSGEQGEAYAFPHRSFQEFLAGYHISAQDDYDRLCIERAGQIHWHEALRLMVSYQVLAQDRRGQPLQLARDLLERGPLEQVLAGEVLNQVEWARAADYRPDVVAPGGLWQQAQAKLLVLSTEGHAPEVSAPLRVRAGIALGTLCYGSISVVSLPGSVEPLTDPRLLDAQIGDAQDGHYWCDVDAGPFWYGDDRAEDNKDTDEGVEEEDDGKHAEVQAVPTTNKLQQVELPYDFKIARYPVTNAEYARFIAAGGYSERRWWTDEGWKFLQPGGHRFDNQKHHITLPRLWSDPEINNPLQPVVGISWYEAAAYCLWLTECGHNEGWLAKIDSIRLPTSLEWERAVRHTDQRRYPWGSDDLTPERANYAETGTGVSSPIGCFAMGMAVCGVQDTLGNVWEWTATEWEDLDTQDAQEDFTIEEHPTLRGNAYYGDKEQMFCGSRVRIDPYYRYGFLGFRIVWSLAARFEASEC